jgi:hypothetical protein
VRRPALGGAAVQLRRRRKPSGASNSATEDPAPCSARPVETACRCEPTRSCRPGAHVFGPLVAAAGVGGACRAIKG